MPWLSTIIIWTMCAQRAQRGQAKIKKNIFLSNKKINWGSQTSKGEQKILVIAPDPTQAQRILKISGVRITVTYNLVLL